MAITKTQAVQGLAALMFGQAVGTASAANFREILATNPSIYDLANNLAATDAFNSQFEDGASTQDKIDLILGRLGLEEDTVGYDRANDFINARLEAGVPAGQVVAEIGEKLLGDTIPRGLEQASLNLQDAIERSNAYLEAGNEGNQPLLLADGLTTALLADAIEQLQATIEARVEFLEDASEVQALGLVGAEFDAEATATAIDTYYTETAGVLSTATGDGQFATRSASTQDTLIAEEQEEANTAVADAAEDLEDNVVTAVNNVQARVAAANNAVEALGNAQTAFDAQATTFLAANDTYTTAIITGTDLQIDSTTVATQGPDGTFNLVNQATVDINSLQGFDALLSAANVQGRAEVAVTSAEDSLNAAVANVAELLEDSEYNDGDYVDVDATDGTYSVTFDDTAGDAIEAYAGVSAYLDALTDRQVLNDAVADFQEARDLNTQLISLTEARDNAEDVITEDYDFNIVEGLGDATNDNDLYIFEDATGNFGTDTDIDNFGDEGTDYIFFGEGYTAVALGDGAITDRVGSSSALEIFWQQDGDNLVLYVEADATAGNSTATADITEITLTGVNVQDVDFSNGFLSVNSAA
ncbi:hypothetical protein [Halomonas sp. GD1P12]|uniref:hypothetical protein n=1 Tax=Halomonas sp. GD1P12 TaxID=2982691 RepID=UPI0021E3E7FA|nr:hypothetical protein [Halomonas sp. GD1P12]UYF98751.1 hypothetical protein OCT39_10960 [Halomonas sp. GD1P12]